MISPSSTNPRVTQVGDYIFRVCFIDPFQGAVMAQVRLRHAEGQEGRDPRRTSAATTPSASRPSSGQHFKQLGGKIVAEQSYSQGDSDFRAQLTAIKAANPEAIFVPGYYTEVGTIARQARELGITVPLLGGDGWDSPKLWEIGGDGAERLLLLQPLLGRRPDPGRPEVRRPTTRRSTTSCPTRSRPSPTTPRGSWPTR